VRNGFPHDDVVQIVRDHGQRVFSNLWTAGRVTFEFEELTDFPEYVKNFPPGNEDPDNWILGSLRQLHDELERRASVSINQLQQQIEQLGHQLLEVTARLVEKQTWLNQIRKTGGAQKQALGAYAAMRNRLTKTGKGVRDAELRVRNRIDPVHLILRSLAG